jgi:hypothetical protein
LVWSKTIFGIYGFVICKEVFGLNELNVLTSEKHFVLDKTLFKKAFYAAYNSAKRIWFFQHFLQ